LIYFAHGFFLAKFHQPLINETVSAWKFGPVIYSIYHAFKNYGNSPIANVESSYFVNKEQVLPKDVQFFLKEVWDLLKEYSAIQLANLTHVHKSPWDVVIENNGAIISNSLPISDSLIQDYFKREYVK
jgi:uncharacterized phage-associated protein